MTATLDRESGSLAAHYDYCEDRLKQGRRSEWLAALFAPAEQRKFLHAIGAFALEIEGVRSKVREPLAGELRMQWWNDAIEGETRGDIRGHPIAAALIDTVHRRRLPRALLTGYVDAMRGELYDEPPPTVEMFDRHADATYGALFVVRAMALTDKRDEVLSEAARHAGRAAAALRAVSALSSNASRVHAGLPTDLLTREGLDVGEVAARHRSPALGRVLASVCRYAESEIDALRALRPRIDPAAAAAFLPANLAVPALREAARPAFDPFRASPTLSQWRNQLILWRAARRNGVL